MNKATLIINGTQSTIVLEELTIERIIAEAHSLGYGQFSVFCNDKEIEKPEDFKAVAGATYIIACPEDAELENLKYDVIEDENEPQ